VRKEEKRRHRSEEGEEEGDQDHSENCSPNVRPIVVAWNGVLLLLLLSWSPPPS